MFIDFFIFFKDNARDSTSTRVDVFRHRDTLSVRQKNDGREGRKEGRRLRETDGGRGCGVTIRRQERKE